MAICKYCQQPIIWATDRDGGVRVPLDPEPDRDYGKLLFDERQKSFVRLNPEMIQRAIEKRDQELYVDHRTTCAARPRFRDARERQLAAD